VALVLFDLAARDPAVRFSPFSWRIKMALAHKSIAHETVPWRFTEKNIIQKAGVKTSPVIEHDGRWLGESFAIALYLDEAFPDQPLMRTPAERELTRAFATWVDTTVIELFARQIIVDIVPILQGVDQVYFRETREARFKQSLEAVSANRDQTLPDLRRALEPGRTPVRHANFICGPAPGYADYVLFAAFQWVRCASGRSLLASDDPLERWRLRMLDLHGGYAAKAPVAYPERITS
jgi:glutathione S-transferase